MNDIRDLERQEGTGLFGLGVRRSTPIRWGGAYAGAVYLTGIVLSVLLFRLAGGTPGDDSPSAGVQFVSSLGLWIAFVGGAWIAATFLGSGSMRRDLGWAARPRDLPLGLVAGALTQLVLVPVVSWPVERIWHTDVNAPTQQVLNSRGTIALVYLAVIVCAPIAEELFYRGVLLRALDRRYADRIAIAGSSLLFAASHFKAAQLPGLFVTGVVFAVLATHHRRLGPAIVAHMAFNATAVLMSR